jgi:hypothetical protein
MRSFSLKCKNALIRPALDKLYYDGEIDAPRVGRKTYWFLRLQNVKRADVLPANDSEKNDGAR